MFEIGQTLRAARERQGLERADVERETHIRERYLRALEEEHFEDVPGRAYAKGFVRVYAEFLGLDSAAFADELDELLPLADGVEVPAPEVARRRPGRRFRRAVALLALLLLGAVGAAVWRLEAGSGRRAPVRAALPQGARAVPKRSPVRAAAPSSVRLALTAAGPCWLLVRVGSDTGPVLYEGTLAAGKSLRYALGRSRPRLWIRAGAPWNLRLALGGRAVAPVPHATAAPANLLATRTAVTPAG